MTSLTHRCTVILTEQQHGYTTHNNEPVGVAVCVLSLRSDHQQRPGHPVCWVTSRLRSVGGSGQRRQLDGQRHVCLCVEKRKSMCGCHTHERVWVIRRWAPGHRQATGPHMSYGGETRRRLVWPLFVAIFNFLL